MQMRLAFAILDEELRGFEQSMIAFRKVVEVESRVNATILRAATDAGVRAARLGLFACGPGGGGCGEGTPDTSFADAIVSDRDSKLTKDFKVAASELANLIVAKRERSLWRPSDRSGL